MKQNKWISVIPIFLFCVCLLSGCEEKTPISLEDFQSILEDHGCTIKGDVIDENGNLTMAVCWNPIGGSYTEYYFYDKYGDKIADAKTFDVDGKLQRNKYTYESYEEPIY